MDAHGHGPELGIDLWWVFGFVGGDVLFSGSGGTILRYHDGAFDPPMTTPSSDGIVFGMWGPTDSDIWAVGRASTEGGGFDRVALRRHDCRTR